MIIPSPKKITSVNFVFPEGSSLVAWEPMVSLKNKCYRTGGKRGNSFLSTSAEVNQKSLLLMKSQ